MPTATTTITKKVVTDTVKADLKLSTLSSTTTDSVLAPTSTTATLRPLYTRAARAFVLRDIETTFSLLQSAFSLLKPPKANPDCLSDDRRKWDILRITFESTVYSSPPPFNNKLPESLRYISSEAPQALVTSMYNRSLSLFTPSGSSQKLPLNAACLPSQVLTTLVYCSLKLGAPDIGRVMIEDWLARREPYDSSKVKGEHGYDKVLELYCLHILPKLGQWEYTKEFLEYESELPAHRREHLKTTLQLLQIQEMTPKRSSMPPSTPSSSSASASGSLSPRSYSPAPSSSSSSSVSTTSTHTVVPATPRGRSIIGLSSLSSRLSFSTESSPVSNGTATPQASVPNGHKLHHHHHRHPQPATHRPTNHNRSPSKARTHSSSSSVYSNLARTRVAQELSRPSSPSALTLIKASLTPYLRSPRLTTILLIFILVPLISFVLRLRRRRRLAELGRLASVAGPFAIGTAASAAVSNADLVRRRLHGSGNESGLVKKAWNEVVRVVADTVRMAGSGLV